MALIASDELGAVAAEEEGRPTAGSALPVSPELALVDPQLRAQAIASLDADRLRVAPVAKTETVLPAESRYSAMAEDGELGDRRSMMVAVPVYLAGSLVTSFVFGVAFVATIAAVIVLLNALG